MINHLFWTPFLLVLPFCANALGFGELSVTSFLDQPLKARVELVPQSGLQADEIHASLADAEIFRKAGLERPFLLSKLRFKTVAAEDGRAYIEITSRESIREPYLDFLVELAWRGGTLVKEFTVLLDPPIYRPATVAAAAVPAPPAAAPGAALPPAAPPAATYGPVKSSETLWVIAKDIRPNPGYSIEQMMMALQSGNPGAFRRGNVNLLKQGVVLAIPERALIEQLTPGEARRAFLQQTREWREMRGREPGAPVPEAAAEPGASRSAATPLQQQPAQRVLKEVSDENVETAGQFAKLRVVEPGNEWPSDSDVAASESHPSGEEDKLRQAITDSASDLAAVREINRDLEELREALESKIEALRKSLEEKERTIATMVRRLNQDSAKAGVAGEGPGTTTAEAPDDRATIASRLRVAEDSARQDTARIKPQTLESTESKDAVWAQSYWLPLLVVAGLVVLLMAAALLRKRRERAGLGEPDAFDSFLELDQGPQIAAPRSPQQPAAKAAEHFRSYEDYDEPGPKGGADVGSALTEADVYLAYRRYTQAENLMREAILNNPKSMILCAKLLEIYAFRKDTKSFTAFMEEMHQTMTLEAPEIWAKVVEMGRDLIPRHPLIAHSVLPEELHLEGFGVQEPVLEPPHDLASEVQGNGGAPNSRAGDLSLMQVDFDQDGNWKKS